MRRDARLRAGPPPRYCRWFRSGPPTTAIAAGSWMRAVPRRRGDSPEPLFAEVPIGDAHCYTAGSDVLCPEATLGEGDVPRRRRPFRKERIAVHRSAQVAQRPKRSLCAVSKRRGRAGCGTQAAQNNEGPAPAPNPSSAGLLAAGYSPRTSRASIHSSSRASRSVARSLSFLFWSARASKSDAAVLLTIWS